MKRNVKQQMKTSRKMLLIAGVSSILGITIIIFLFYSLSNTEDTVAGKNDGISATRNYVENENLTVFEVKEARIRPTDDPVAKGERKYMKIQDTPSN